MTRKNLFCVSNFTHTLIVVCFFVCSATVAHGSHYQKFYSDTYYEYNDNSCIVRRYNISQHVDHFDLLGDKFFNQLYAVNDCYYKEGGPVFIFFDSSSLNTDWLEQSTLMDSCRKLHCVAYMLEHRYSGNSYPVEDRDLISVESLKYYTIEQALADWAHFVRTIIKTSYKYNKIVGIGGGYAGSLVTWFSVKYPALVDIVWSSDGGGGYNYNGIEYFEIVGKVIYNISPKCYKEIELGFSHLNEILQSPAQTHCGPNHNESCENYVKRIFNLCENMDSSKEDDVANFNQVVAQHFAAVVQSNSQMGNYTMEILCSSIFENPSSKLNSVEKVARFVEVIERQSQFSITAPCMNHTQERFCYTMQNDSRFDEVFNNYMVDRRWLWLLCTQLMSFQTSDGKYQPFGHRFPIELLVSQCQCTFDERFNEYFLKRKHQEFLGKFGGIAIHKKTHRNIYVGAANDPWNFVEVRFDHQTTCFNKVIFIAGESSGTDLTRSNDTVRPAVIKARQEIFAQIAQWLKAEEKCCPNTLENYYSNYHSDHSTEY